METIYLLVISLGIIGVGFHLLSFLFSLILLFFISIVAVNYNFKSGIIVLIFSTIFLVRLEFSTMKKELYLGDRVKIITTIKDGKGRLEKVNGQYFKNKGVLNIDKVENGEYEIDGKVLKIEKEKNEKKYYFQIKKIEKRKGIKNYLSKKIDRITEPFTYRLNNFFKGVILGEDINYELKKKFIYTGTAHLLVISGLHIGIIISGTLYLLRKMGVNRKINNIVTLILVTIYSFAIGFTPSLLRAYLMGSVYILGNILYEKNDSKKTLAISFIFSLLIAPWWFYNISFWMSYIAVFSIIYIYPRIPKFHIEKEILKKIVDYIILSFTIQVCMLPIFVIYFKSVPIFTFITNFFIVPLGSIIIFLAFITLMLSMIHLNFLTSYILNFLFYLLLKLVDILYEIPCLTLEI